ncbi:MAG: biotin--[acetyl-CoA-carboxylase] ligase [Methanomicrobiales archaeon]|nr:biotin--[acetyl-CoA-carboxylase] ligase [Methanomicrobiales archaeon]
MDDVARRVLEELRESAIPRSGRELGEKAGITMAEVSRAIRTLRKQGYRIQTKKKGIYQFEQTTSKLLPYEVQRLLRTEVIGRQMQYYEKITSTSTVAKDLISTQDPAIFHGMVIIAEEQTGGTGRLGRAWISPGGGIWTTLILKPRIPVDRLFMLTMVGSIAVVRAIKKITGIGSLIKWPNDIYIGNRKVGGIITELSAEGPIVHYCLVGIGIDVNIPLGDLPTRLRESATSLSAELGHEVDRAPLLATLLREFELRYLQIESNEYDSIVREWKSLSCTLEHRVRINLGSRSFDGDAIDIDDYGALIVRKDSGAVERVIAGDCLHL